MELRRSIEAAARRAWLRALALEASIVALGAIVYIVVRKLTEGNPDRAVANARQLYSFERQFGIDGERWLNEFVLQHDMLRNLVNWVYIWGHWPVIITVASWLYVNRRERYRWLRTAIFASGMIGFAFFALVPMAPPRLAGLGYVDTITRWSSSYRVLQPPSYANLYAAMPSLHFGWDLLVGVALFTSTRVLAVRIFALVMPSLMLFAVVSTANHWILDVVVGLLVVTAGATFAELIPFRARRRRAVEHSRQEPVRESVSSW